MKINESIALLAGLALLGLAVPFTTTVSADEGVAVAIVYDTSGSMKDTVRDSSGRMVPKHTIARRAMDSVVKRLQTFATNTTDGVNTVGPEPATVLPRIKDQAGRKQAVISAHFVTFDIDAKLFDPLKKQGVTVVGAANEEQLNAQLGFILEKKILLEDEEPPTKPKSN